MTTLKFFLGPRPLPKNLAIFFLAIFGFACEDQKDHYEESATLSYYQYSILADLHNHTDWDCLTDVIPLGTIHILRIAQILIWLPNFSLKLGFFGSKQKNINFNIPFWQNFHDVEGESQNFRLCYTAQHAEAGYEENVKNRKKNIFKNNILKIFGNAIFLISDFLFRFCLSMLCGIVANFGKF